MLEPQPRQPTGGVECLHGGSREAGRVPGHGEEAQPFRRPGDNEHHVSGPAVTSSKENAAVESLTPLWRGANFLEREIWDLFGIKFIDHPDLRRILMWDGYPYHPLRKEFPLAGIETDLPVADIAEETGTKVIAAPMAGGPFVASPGEVNLTEAEPRAKDESWSDRRARPDQSPLRQVNE